AEDLQCHAPWGKTSHFAPHLDPGQSSPAVAQTGTTNGLVKDPSVCAPGRIRTCDTRFRRAVLYPLSYEGGPGSWPGASVSHVLPFTLTYDPESADRQQ